MEGRGSCWDHCGCASFNSSLCSPKVGAVGKSADAAQTQLSSLCLAPESLCFVHHTRWRCRNSLMDFVLSVWGSSAALTPGRAVPS